MLEIEDKSIGRIRMPGVPVKISGIDDRDIASAPRLGENTGNLLENLGYSRSEIQKMAEKNIVMCERGDL